MDRFVGFPGAPGLEALALVLAKSCSLQPLFGLDDRTDPVADPLTHQSFKNLASSCCMGCVFALALSGWAALSWWSVG